VLPKPARDENDYRKYQDTAAKSLGLIHAAQRLGFSLSEIRAALAEAAPAFPSRGAMAKALRSKLANMEQHMKDARARRREIMRLLGELGG
jgi:DNA-binding transcriptional MerR regulator